MKFKIIALVILLFNISAYLLLNNTKSSIESEIFETENISLSDKEIEEIIDEEISDDNNPNLNDNSISNNANNSKTVTNDAKSSNFNNNNSNDNPSSNNISTKPGISQISIWDWMINDFSVSDYGSKELAFNACDQKGEQFIKNYGYFCTDVINVDGILIGYMLRLKEHNTGNDFDWRY